MGKTYLVTGGAGFVGLAVLKLLAKENFEIVSCVKVLDLVIPEDLRKAIESETKGPKFEWIAGDITDRDQVFKAVKGCDVVLHIGAIVPGSFKDDDVTMRKVNVTGSMHVVNACCEYDVSGLVYVSSISVVGPNLRNDPMENLDEDTPYDSHPRSLYGETKKIGEDYVLSANGHTRPDGSVLATCSLRPHYIYGQRFHDMKLFYQSGKRAKKIISIYPYESKATCIYVGNMASAIIHAGKQVQEKSEQVGGKFYYVADDTPPSQIMRTVASVFASVGFTLSKEPFVPFTFAYIFYWMVFHVNLILRRIGMSKARMIGPEYVWRSNTLFLTSDKKFRKDFDFSPKFTPEEATASTTEYLMRIEAMGFAKPIYDFEY